MFFLYDENVTGKIPESLLVCIASGVTCWTWQKNHVIFAYHRGKIFNTKVSSNHCNFVYGKWMLIAVKIWINSKEIRLKYFPSCCGQSRMYYSFLCVYISVDLFVLYSGKQWTKFRQGKLYMTYPKMYKLVLVVRHSVVITINNTYISNS